MGVIRHRRVWIGMGLVAIVALLAWKYVGTVDVQELIAHEQELREDVQYRPLQSLAIGFVIFTALSLVPGLTGKATIVGWLFGFWRGFVIVHFGLLIAGVLEFWFTRYYLHDFIQSRFGFYLLKLNEALRRDGAFYLFILRMAHVPYTATNYVMGATSLRTSAFLLATGLGMLPSNALFVYAGSRVPTLAEIINQGPRSIISPGFIIALLLIGTMPLLVKLFVRREVE